MISFLSPFSLLLLLPFGAVIIVLYLLKMKRKERLVSSVMLWQDAAADLQANAPFQKLKKNLLLFLQLLILLFLIAAIARPYMRAKGVYDNKIVVILDSSASMESTDMHPSRFEDAKSQALDIVEKMGPGNTMLVMTAGSKARVEAPFTSDKKALADVIRRLQPSDAGCNMRQAMLLALSLVSGKSASPPRIAIFSDGGFDPLTDLSAEQAKIDFMRIGKTCRNAAITGMASRKTLSGNQQVYIGIRNFADEKLSFNLEITLDDKLIDIREVSIPAGGSRQEMLDNPGAASGRVTAKIVLDDDLMADNTASVYLSGKRGISALLVSSGNIFLQNALNLDPDTKISRCSAVPADFNKQTYDLVVFDRIAPPGNLPPGGYLLLDTSSALGPADAGQRIQTPAITDFPKNNPINTYVDYTNVRIAQASVLNPKSWGTPILESNGGVIGVAGADRGRRFVQLSWNILESDFPLRVGFPIFIANCLDWLVPIRNASGESVRTGAPVYIDTAADTSSIVVTDPAGQKHKINSAQTPVVFDGNEKAGIYKIEGKAAIREFASSILSSQESNTAPKDTLVVGSKTFASGNRAIYTNREYFSILILLALLVLTIEWYAYHRRV